MHLSPPPTSWELVRRHPSPEAFLRCEEGPNTEVTSELTVSLSGGGWLRGGGPEGAGWRGVGGPFLHPGCLNGEAGGHRWEGRDLSPQTHALTDRHSRTHAPSLSDTHSVLHTLRLTPGLLFLDLEWLPGRGSTSCGTWEHGRNTQESTFLNVWPSPGARVQEKPVLDPGSALPLCSRSSPLASPSLSFPVGLRVMAANVCSRAGTGLSATLQDSSRWLVPGGGQTYS